METGDRFETRRADAAGTPPAPARARSGTRDAGRTRRRSGAGWTRGEGTRSGRRERAKGAVRHRPPAGRRRAGRPGRILRTGARLLLLDEPTEGLAPVIIQQIRHTIGMLKAQGFTVLLVEQNFHFAAAVADRHYVMEHGRIVDEFSTPELKANMGKLHEYLGV